MRLPRLCTLGVLAVGWMTGTAAAQYYPYPYPRPMYQSAYPAYQAPMYPQPIYHPAYGQPTYPQPAYQQPAYQQPAYYPPQYTTQYSPQAPVARPDTTNPIVIMPDRPLSDGPRLPPAPPSALSSTKTVQKHRTMSQPIEVVAEPVGPSPVHGTIAQPCGDACHGDACRADACRAWNPACESCPNDLHRCYAQAGAVLLQPRWNSNPALITQTGTVNGSQDFSYDWTVSPRVETGVQFCGGFGARARYMYFDQRSRDVTLTGTTATTVASAAPLGIFNLAAGTTNNFQVNSTLQFHVGDLEAQQEFRWGCWSLRGSAGGRFAYLDQRYLFTSTTAAGAAAANVDSQSRFVGGGPTVALEGKRYFPKIHTAVYGIGRGSILFGRHEQQVTTLSGAGATRSEEDTLSMLDLEAGVEWWVNVHRCRLFVQLGVVGQVWYGAGNSSNSSPTFTTAGTVDANANSRRDLTLLGLALTVGIQF